MLLYSFFGLLTLQIGVAVLSVLLVIAGIAICISGYSDLQIFSGTVPINYIIMATFTILLLLAGIVMFITAYTENRNLALFSVILLAIILILFLILSGISFYNDPPLNKNVCVPGHKCPESLWLPRLKYKTMTGIEHDNPHRHEQGRGNGTDSSTPSDSIEPTNTTGSGNSTTTMKPQARFEAIGRGGRGRKGKMREGILNTIFNSEPLEEIRKKVTGTSLDTARKLLQNKRDSYIETQEPITYANSNSNEVDKNNNYNSPKNVLQNKLESTEATVQSNFGLSSQNNTYFVDYQNNEGIIKLVKRSIFSIANYIKGEHLPREHGELHPKKKVEYENDDYDGGEESGEGSESNTDDRYMDEEGGESEKSEYIFGLHFILAVIIFLLFVIFLIFSIVILWSYKKQLTYIKLYSINPSSAHYIIP